MLVSFCVIAYNEERTLMSLFKDICAQDYPHENMEVVLVNAMSTDKTREMMEEFAQEEHGFHRVVVTDNPKKKQAAGWNVAIRESQGDIIMRIDAHTQVPKEFVSKNVECLMGGEYVSGGPRPNIAEENIPWKHTLQLAESSMFGSSIAAYRRSHCRTYVKSVFHGAYRREVFEKVGLFNEDLGRTEDNEIHYRIIRAGYRIRYVPDIISYQHTRNTWKGMIRQKYENGYWVGLTTGVAPGCLSLYHFVPFVFVLAIICAICLAVFGNPICLIVLSCIYGIANIVMSLAAVIHEKKYWQYIMLPFIFLSLHTAYGMGTVIGICKMPFWHHKIKKKGASHEEL
ncbi:MAG: glycosyltransferase family 2 protein [Lachnospiraceae bacterium]